MCLSSKTAGVYTQHIEYIRDLGNNNNNNKKLPLNTVSQQEHEQNRRSTNRA